MKRFAICLSGHMRTYEQTFSKFKENILEPLKTIARVDTFIHTWNRISTDKSWNAATDPNFSSSNINKEIRPEHLSELYNLQSGGGVVQIFNPDIFDNKIIFGKQFSIPNNTGDNNMFWFSPMFYKILACNYLKQAKEQDEGFEYDAVIRYRPDTYIDGAFPLSILDNLDKFYTEHVNPPESAYGDVFWVGKSKDMDIVCNLFDHLKELIDPNNLIGPEQILYKWITQNNIPVETFPVGIRFVRKI